MRSSARKLCQPGAPDMKKKVWGGHPQGEGVEGALQGMCHQHTPSVRGQHSPFISLASGGAGEAVNTRRVSGFLFTSET